jgi:hypothetical protein
MSNTHHKDLNTTARNARQGNRHIFDTLQSKLVRSIG